MKFIQWRIYPKALLIFALLFAAFVPIGTITHELGHMSVAWLHGYKAQLHYAYATHEESPIQEELFKLYDDNHDAIRDQLGFPDKEKLIALQDAFNNENFLISAGGPLQTILTGMLGLLILYFRKTRHKTNWSWSDWLAVFLSLFWLREIFNLLVSFELGSSTPGMGISYGGDEYYMALMKQLPPGTFAIPLGVLGALVALYVVFWVVPVKYRLSFVIAGFAGAAIGFAGWMMWLGPMLLP